MLPLKGFPMVQPGDDISRLIIRCLGEQRLLLEPGDVLVVAQKVISKAENRYVELARIEPSAEARELAAKVAKDPRLVEVILSESNAVVRHAPGVLIVEHKLGLVMANAGIDGSNIEHDRADAVDRVLLLPAAPDRTADELRRTFVNFFGVNTGIIINDSVGRAWRNGTVGLALGVSGLPALWDRRGEQDLFGRTLEVTEVALADQLASAASLVQGEGAEGCPVVLIRGLRLSSIEQRHYNDATSLVRDRDRDLFR